MKVDIQYILKAFENGADGVLVLACYEDGCKYLTGNTRAKKRVAYAKQLLEAAQAAQAAIAQGSVIASSPPGGTGTADLSSTPATASASFSAAGAMKEL